VKDYLEQYVWLPANHWRSILHGASLPACIVSLVMGFFFLCWTFLLEDPRYHVAGDYILIVVLFILAGLFFLAKKFIGESMDYTFSGGDFTIARIIDDSRRVKVADFSMEAVEIFAPISHEDYEKYKLDTTVKQVKGYLDEKADLYFVVYMGEESRQVLTFQPNAEMVELLAASNPEVSKL